MSNAQITIHELLHDKEYRKYFLKAPVLPPTYMREGSTPFKLIIRRKGETAWRTRRFATYRDAFAALKKLLPSIEDGAINTPALSWMPPVRFYRLKNDPPTKVRSQMWRATLEADHEAHYWCAHCRRPSVWSYGQLNINRSGAAYRVPLGEPVLRCGICGVSDRMVDLRHPENHQLWDVNRPKLEKVVLGNNKAVKR